MRVELLPGQFDFVEDAAPWLLAYGGRGSAKTTGGCWKVYNRARVPGAREGLFRQRLIDLKGTTLKTLIDGDGNSPPVIPPGTYSHNRELKTIKIHGGGEIVYNGLDQGDVGREAGSTGKGSSMNLTGATFDEAVEMNEHAVVQVCMSVRVPIDGLPLQRSFLCNPGPPSHWIAKRWGLTRGASAMPGHVSYHLRPHDNYFLPDTFMAELDLLEGVARRRYRDGEWAGSDGLVFDRFNRDTHAVARTGIAKRRIIGVDDGYTDPFVALDIHVDSDGRYHVAREVYETRLVMSEKVARVKSLVDPETVVVVDSAAPDLIETLRRAGVQAVPADKGQGSVAYGINVVQTKLAPDDRGVPSLTVDPCCTNTIREFETYEWASNQHGLKDQPRDRDNHAMDSLRYGITNGEAGRAPAPVVFDRAEAAREAMAGSDEHMWSTWQ